MKKDIFKWLVLALVAITIICYFLNTRYFIGDKCNKSISSSLNYPGALVLDRWTGDVRCR